jgi:hypothetical protein
MPKKQFLAIKNRALLLKTNEEGVMGVTMGLSNASLFIEILEFLI